MLNYQRVHQHLSPEKPLFRSTARPIRTLVSWVKGGRMKPINSKVSAHLRFVTVCLDRMYPSIQRMGMCTFREVSRTTSIARSHHCGGCAGLSLPTWDGTNHNQHQPTVSSHNVSEVLIDSEDTHNLILVHYLDT